MLVYNHNSEATRNGSTLSCGGFARTPFNYQQERVEAEYQDVTVQANTIAANRPLVRRLIIRVDCVLGPGAWARWLPLRFWTSPLPRREMLPLESAAPVRGDRSRSGAQRPKAGE